MTQSIYWNLILKKRNQGGFMPKIYWIDNIQSRFLRIRLIFCNKTSVKRIDSYSLYSLFWTVAILIKVR